MKICVLSDTHIPDRAKELPSKLLDELKTSDMAIHAGDLVDMEVYNTLCKACKDVRVVSGNMDPAELKNKFPQKELIKAGNFTIGVVHGWGSPERLLDIVKDSFKGEGNPDIIIFGHSHRPYNRREGKTLYFNPGSVTDDVFAEFKSFGIIEITDTITARIEKL